MKCQDMLFIKVTIIFQMLGITVFRNYKYEINLALLAKLEIPLSMLSRHEKP